MKNLDKSFHFENISVILVKKKRAGGDFLLKFYCIPTCSTCKAAKKWLTQHKIEFEEINLKTDPPAKAEVMDMFEQSELSMKRFFNTSGMVYREKGLKESFQHLSQEEAAELLSTEGMLVKRPLIVADSSIIVGFKEENYQSLLQ